MTTDAPRKGRLEAAAAIWEPRSDSAARATSERIARARRRATVRAVVLGSAGCVFVVWLERPWLGAIAAAVAAVVLALARLSPDRAYASLERGERAIGRIVSGAIAIVLFAPVLYLVLSPFRLLFRRGARDRLARRRVPEAQTYWRRRDRPIALDRPY